MQTEGIAIIIFFIGLIGYFYTERQFKTIK